MASVVVLAGLGAAVGVALLPRTANHFGYALPGDNGLPDRVQYNGRDYRGHPTCARVATGRGAQVGAVPTLFGEPHAVYVPSGHAAGESVIWLMVEASGGCYARYTLLGGP